MRKQFLILFLLGIICGSCSNTKEKTKEKVIFVSILPLKYFADKIVGNLYRVEVTVPPGAGPETYSPNPRQMKRLTEADAYFAIGFLSFEMDLLNKFSSLNPDLKVFQVSKDINLLDEREENHTDHVHLQGVDPHIWSSPKEAKIISKNIFEGMAAIDPGNRAYYAKNLQLLLDSVNQVDSTVNCILSDGKLVKKFVIFHPALGYFARDYGLEQLSIEFEGKVPSPKHMQELIQAAKEGSVRTVFIQKEFDKRNAEIVAEEIGAKVVQIDPLDYKWGNQMVTIAKMIAADK